MVRHGNSFSNFVIITIIYIFGLNTGHKASFKNEQMNFWVSRIIIGYSLLFFFHFLFSETMRLGQPFWLGDIYWVGTGISLFGVAQSVDKTTPGKFAGIYFFGGLIRMLLGVGIIIIPIILKEADNFYQVSLEFVGTYLYCLSLETIIAISWVKKQ
jgi:hypothetical protein